MVEIIDMDNVPASAYIQNDLTPFVSTADGTWITSRSVLRDHMARKDLVPFDPTVKPEIDRYKKARDDQAMRERIYEGVDRVLRTGRGPNG
jgi:hypothetical protein